MHQSPFSKVWLLAASLPLLLATHAAAAMIIWNAPVTVDLNDPTQVLNNGTLSTSYAASGNQPTLNGFVFQSNAPTPAIFGYTNGGGNGGSVTTPYSSILTAAIYITNTQAAGGTAMVYQSLTIGQTYEFQVWSGFGSGDSIWYSAIAPTLSGGVYSAIGQSGSVLTSAGGGQFVVGTFIADATTQSLYYYGSGTSGDFAAYQLRAIAPVPEPTTWALAATGFAVVCFRLRRKQQS